MTWMNLGHRTGLAWLLLALATPVAWAAPDDPCAGLTPEQQQTHQALLAALHPYAGCDETFARCLARTPPDPLVVRQAGALCRHLKAGQSRPDIERWFSKRAQTLLPTGKPAAFQLDSATLAGDPKAPVNVVVYACVRCPFCRVIVPALYQEVTTGSLQGKVRLYFQPFPLKDHEGSVEGGLALLAAARLGKFWPLLLLMYQRYDAYCPARLTEWAEEVGLEREAFEREMKDPQLREALVAAKQEGIRNRVEATPTLYVEGRKYVYELKQEPIIDLLLEAAETRPTSGSQP